MRKLNYIVKQVHAFFVHVRARVILRPVARPSTSGMSRTPRSQRTSAGFERTRRSAQSAGCLRGWDALPQAVINLKEDKWQTGVLQKVLLRWSQVFTKRTVVQESF